MNAVPQEVEDLCSYLASTGTGTEKLNDIRSLAQRARGPEEFFSLLPQRIPEGTMNKVGEYLAKVREGATAGNPVEAPESHATAIEEPTLTETPAPVVEAPSEAPTVPSEAPKPATQGGRRKGR